MSNRDASAIILEIRLKNTEVDVLLVQFRWAMQLDLTQLQIGSVCICSILFTRCSIAKHYSFWIMCYINFTFHSNFLTWKHNSMLKVEFLDKLLEITTQLDNCRCAIQLVFVEKQLSEYLQNKLLKLPSKFDAEH